MKIATTTYDMKHFASRADEAVELLSQTPWRYLDFGFGKLTPEESWDEIIHNSAEAAARHGMKFVQAHATDVRLMNPKYDEAQELARFERTLKACKVLGIPKIVLHALFAPSDSPMYPEGKEEFFTRNLKFYQRLYPMMERYGVQVLVENSAQKNTAGHYYFMTGAELREFLDRADHPLLGAVWDVGHANMENDDQYQSILALGEKLAAVHIHDNFGVRDTHGAPFNGITDFDAILRGLIDAKFQGAFTLECDNYPVNPGGWPYKRRESPEPRLRHVNLEIKLECERLLYRIAESMLRAYDIFEE